MNSRKKEGRNEEERNKDMVEGRGDETIIEAEINKTKSHRRERTEKTS